MFKLNKRVLIIGALLLVAAGLQFTFWFGKNSVKTLKETEALIAAEDAHIESLRKRNQKLVAEILDLKDAEESMEERARVELGYVKEGEVFYRVVETDKAVEYSRPVINNSE